MHKRPQVSTQALGPADWLTPLLEQLIFCQVWGIRGTQVLRLLVRPTFVFPSLSCVCYYMQSYISD